MELSPLAVTSQLVLELIDGTGAASPLLAELTYDPADPLAVVATFGTPEAPVRWVFGRELLAEGLFSPAGDGDVHMWPCLDTRGCAVVIIELSSPYGQAMLQAPSSDVSDFLQRTFALVPRGTEYVDLDDALVRLLAAGPTDS